jgi:type III pantothenate kinase
MKLLIDLGNTRMKWATWDGATLGPADAVAHDGSNVDFSGVLRKLRNIDAVWIASVASSALNKALTSAARECAIAQVRFVSSSAQACGVRNAYAQPERLGIDRFLGLIAARGMINGPVVVVSCGTALTLDAMTIDGVHLGGLIAASPELALAALRGGTANLRAAPSGRLVEIADNTADAMESGAWLCAVALVERFFAQSSLRVGTAPTLVLAGGAAPRLGPLLTVPHRIEPELVLHGLARLAQSVG